MNDGLDRHQRLRALFERVRLLPVAAQADALIAACPDDSSLRNEVAELLASDAHAGSFLERGAAAALADRPSLKGQRIGLYEIREAIGAGAMGEVYRAHDTKLRRDVALKILPEIFANNPDRLGRFQREAQVLASLNHPNIAAIYGLAEADGIQALVLELVEGPTLADRIAKGPLPLDEALRIGRQLVDAFEAAHERGVIHRDLKPANIKCRPDGTVKVLDFGLAKVLEAAEAPIDTSKPSTITNAPMTHVGMLMGTPAYMSPEQTKGASADRRSDVWAFGCVLFEMLTGDRAFKGADVADTLALVLTREPDWASLPAETPTSIRRLLRRCLQKERGGRLADIADARLDFEESAVEATPSPASLPSKPPDRIRRWLPWSIAAASLGAAIWLATAMRSRPEADTPVYRSVIPLPARLGTLHPIRGSAMALSPDGRRLAFVATDASWHTMLWMRSLDNPVAHPLASTDDARSPFWSPDSQWVAFVAKDKLKRVEPSSGRALTICQSALTGGAWSPNDTILFTQSNNSLAQVPAAGGTPSAVTTIGPQAREFYHVASFFLPDGRRFVYAALHSSGDLEGVYVTTLGSDQRMPLPIDTTLLTWHLQYAPGFVLFARGNTLMAQPFDARRGTLAGEAVPVAEGLRAYSYGSAFSVSATGGALVFATEASRASELTWFDRAGRPTGTLGSPADYDDLSLSPDGRRLLVSIGESGTANRDLWIFDVARGTRIRFTSDPAPETHSVWSPDGARIAFDSRRSGHFDLYQKLANGTGNEEVLLADEFDKNPVAWSPDGQFVLYIRRSGPTVNIWALPLIGKRKPFPLTNSEFNVPGSFSPDGHWFVYFSRDSGRFEVYVAPFPGPGPKTLISTDGGLDARWRRDGKEILYLDFVRGKLMAASVAVTPDTFEVREVRELFDLPKVGLHFTYDVSPDGQRIVALTRKPETAPEPLTLIVNWPALLKK